MILARLSLAGTILGLVLAASSHARADGTGWDTGTAAELVRQGQEYARKGDEDVATHRFADAIRLEPSYGPAYMELAAARERSGDLEEAERTYDVALRCIPDFVPALRARAALLHRLGEYEREMTDLETAVRLTDEPDPLRDLARRHVEDRAWPAALATWRKILVSSERRGDERAVREANVQIRALVILAAELDPVSAGGKDRDWVRRSEAAVARRRGM